MVLCDWSSSDNCSYSRAGAADQSDLHWAEQTHRLQGDGDDRRHQPQRWHPPTLWPRYYHPIHVLLWAGASWQRLASVMVMMSYCDWLSYSYMTVAHSLSMFSPFANAVTLVCLMSSLSPVLWRMCIFLLSVHDISVWATVTDWITMWWGSSAKVEMLTCHFCELLVKNIQICVTAEICKFLKSFTHRWYLDMMRTGRDHAGGTWTWCGLDVILVVTDDKRLASSLVVLRGLKCNLILSRWPD